MPGTGHDLRVGIIGAGCAGLAAAEELRTLGYHRVTILEARTRAGGQCVSETTEDAEGRPVIYDSGTVWAIPSPHITRYAQRYGLPDARLPRRPALRYVDLRREGRLSHPFMVEVNGRVSAVRRALELGRYLVTMERFRRRDPPGFTNSIEDPTSTGRIEDWFASRSLRFPFAALFPIVGNALTGGHVPRVPAIYYLKLLALLQRFSLPTLISLRFPHFAAGNDALWRRMAASHDTRHGEVVRRIVRGACVTVETSRMVHEFDRVIWTAPLDRFAEIAEATDDERDLFGRVRHACRSVVTCRVQGLRSRPIMYQAIGIPDGREVLPYSWYEVRAGSGIYNFYSHLRYPDEILQRATLGEAVSGIESMLSRFGATLVEVHRARVWDKFFPHFCGDDLRAGIHARLDAMQGRGGLYFAGELLAHVSVPLNVEFAVDLVHRHFGQRMLAAAAAPVAG